ncbi:MAG: FKBP-type peptidyl-prolyl cis-trans isomerase [Bacteroidales bacterium]
MKINRIGLSVILIFALITNACKKQETGYELYQKEQKKLKEYLEANNITVQPDENGLYYIETLAGTGEASSYGQTVTVDYVGKFLDGTEFDSGTMEFVVGYSSVIQGFQIGVSKMKDGGKATLIIPSSLAYGAYGSGDIGPYTTLIFDIEVTNVQ